MVSLVRRFHKLLIANRGEIACRIIRTARRMGLTHGRGAFGGRSRCDACRLSPTRRCCIGPAPAKDSYLHIEAIIDAARTTGAEAIHPGYGFLSENAEFAQACADAGLVFVGPSAATIRLMGSKSAAKALMESAGVPVVPGYHGEDQSLANTAVGRRCAWAIRCWSRRRPAAEGGGCGSSATPMNSLKQSQAPSAKRVRHSAATRS